jgi:hypothetical protein
LCRPAGKCIEPVGDNGGQQDLLGRKVAVDRSWSYACRLRDCIERYIDASSRKGFASSRQDPLVIA